MYNGQILPIILTKSVVILIHPARMHVIPFIKTRYTSWTKKRIVYSQSYATDPKMTTMMAPDNKKSPKEKFRLFGRRRSCSPLPPPAATAEPEEVSVVVDATGIESTIATKKTLQGGSQMSTKKHVSINPSGSTEATAWAGLSLSQSSGVVTGHPASSEEETIESNLTTTDDVVDTIVSMLGYLGIGGVLDEGQELLPYIDSRDDSCSVSSDGTLARASAASCSSSYGSDESSYHSSFSETGVGDTVASDDKSIWELSFPTDETFDDDDDSASLTAVESQDTGTTEEESTEEARLCASTTSTTSSTVENNAHSAGEDEFDANSCTSSSSSSQDYHDVRESSHDVLLEQPWEATPSGPPKSSQYLTQRRRLDTTSSSSQESEFSDEEYGAYIEVFITQIDF